MLNDGFKVKGSAGQGQWADVPWYAVFDKDITINATRGYYIVYLFRADMSGVYLSLNQGFTNFQESYGAEKGRENIRKVARAWQELLSENNKFSFDPIDLRSNQGNDKRPRGYELGHICGKFYDANSMPSDKELVSDAKDMLIVYSILKSQLVDFDIDKTNRKLLIELESEKFEHEADLDEAIANPTIFSLTEEAPPPQLPSKKHEEPSFIPHKIDYIKKARVQSKRGKAGELWVFELEKAKVGKKYTDKVCLFSQEKGDGAGFDILSVESDGSPKYIEVKTTPNGPEEVFYISPTELEFSKRNPEHFYLYRIYNFNAKKQCGKLNKIAPN